VLVYRAALPLSRKTLSFVSGIIRRHRASTGPGWRKLNSGQQALLVLVHLRNGETLAYAAVGGTLTPVDRVAADKPFCSGKHKKHGMNLQVIARAHGDILWVPGPLPGSVHDKKAEWIWGVPHELQAARLATLADKGYQGSAYAKIPYRAKNKPESQKKANRAHAKLRSPGERANAQLET
jgi:hypothetical protein